MATDKGNEGMEWGPEFKMMEWRQIISEAIRKVIKGEMSAVNCNAITNAMGKSTSSIKLQLDYFKLVGKTPNIAALAPSKEEEG